MKIVTLLSILKIILLKLYASMIGREMKLKAEAKIMIQMAI